MPQASLKMIAKLIVMIPVDEHENFDANQAFVKSL